MRVSDILRISALAVGLGLFGCAQSGDVTAAPEPTRILLWGDTHLHTSNSSDAFATGNRGLGPEAALRFARGEEVVSTSGQKARLDRPLDFLLITDHAEGLGLSRAILEGHPELIADPQVAKWREMMRAGPRESGLATRQMIAAFSNGTIPPVMRDPEILGPIMRKVWADHIAIVEEFNEPGTFTAFVGYEYSSIPNGDNLHRNVIFRDGAERALQTLPFSSYISQNPADLWAALAAYEQKTGGRAMSIPHNSNLSNGRMFAPRNFDGSDLDAAAAALRRRWEPVVEITQIKGDSESHPGLSPDDPFADYGDAGWDLGNLPLSGAKTPDMLPGDYVREALKTGLAVQAATGVNPFALGFIGSTDAHTGLATADSHNYFSKHANAEPRPGRFSIPASPRIPGLGQRFGWQYLASGYAGVWAEANTREAIFDAIERRETYATTGPRISLRVFAGELHGVSPDEANWIAKAYSNGAPMGGEIEVETPPTLLIEALQDPIGAGLDRLQVIKGWRDADGALRERVFDVAASEGRTPDENWSVPRLKSTVNAADASFDCSQGAERLAVRWTDPEYEAGQNPFYYVRVLEVPTPRWSTYDASRYGIPLPEGAPADIQERAYGSPIWVRSKG